jgi:hypothetical protein
MLSRALFLVFLPRSETYLAHDIDLILDLFHFALLVAFVLQDHLHMQRRGEGERA